jgi:nucleoside-diphosphate-sugar epimerase
MSETKDVAEQFIGVDVIYHLAAAARIQASFDEPTTSLNTNVLGTMELLKLAYEKNKDTGKLPRIVFTSTSSLHKDCEGRALNQYLSANPATETPIIIAAVPQNDQPETVEIHLLLRDGRTVVERTTVAELRTLDTRRTT